MAAESAITNVLLGGMIYVENRTGGSLMLKSMKITGQCMAFL